MSLLPLDHHNEEYVTWKYEDLSFALLGGIRVEGMQSMRLTVKLDFKSYASVRQSVDLYNEGQTEKLVKKVAERFTLSPSYVHTAVGHLINTVEAYRLEALDKNKLKTKQQRPVLTAEEIKAATDFLKGDHLLQRTNACIGASGVIGEEINRLIMYVVFTSRKTSRPLHIISMGSSGAGKSHLQERVGELIPQEDKIELTSVSGNAFYYYVDDDLGHKLVLIEDYDGVAGALYPIRELQSKQRISKTITMRDRSGTTRTLHLRVKGPVSIGGCTTSERVYEDNANRSFLIYVDESEAQDERVMAYQRMLSAGRIDVPAQQEVQKLLQNVQRMLSPISVRNPYALELLIPQEVFKPRRTNAHYIAFIEAITFYKQYQREQKVDEQTGEVYIETTIEDIAEANELMKDILLKKSDELGYATRNFLEQVKTYLQSRGKKTFTTKEIRSALQQHPSTQKRMMVELQQYGYVQKVEGNKKQGYVYGVVSEGEYKALQDRIHQALDGVLSKLRSSVVVQGGSEPLKPATRLKKK